MIATPNEVFLGSMGSVESAFLRKHLHHLSDLAWRICLPSHPTGLNANQRGAPLTLLRHSFGFNATIAVQEY
jgi:hypothetical protein